LAAATAEASGVPDALRSRVRGGCVSAWHTFSDMLHARGHFDARRRLCAGRLAFRRQLPSCPRQHKCWSGRGWRCASRGHVRARGSPLAAAAGCLAAHRRQRQWVQRLASNHESVHRRCLSQKVGLWEELGQLGAGSQIKGAPRCDCTSGKFGRMSSVHEMRRRNIAARPLAVGQTAAPLKLRGCRGCLLRLLAPTSGDGNAAHATWAACAARSHA
jgi:hypothetical protein